MDKELKIYPGYINRNLKKKSVPVVDVEDSINDYFATCDETSKRYTKKGLNFHLMDQLGINPSTFKNMQNNEKYEDVFAWAFLRIDMQLEQNALDIDSRTNSKFTEFILKNFSNYKDKVEVDQNIETTANLSVSLDDQIRAAQKHFNVEDKKED